MGINLVVLVLATTTLVSMGLWPLALGTTIGGIIAAGIVDGLANRKRKQEREARWERDSRR